MTGNKMGG